MLTPPNQVHDFNPGIKNFVDANHNGLFWTVVLPHHSVHAHPGAGRASLHVSDLDMDDYHDVVNALHDGPEVDGRVSIDLEWSDVLSRHHIRNEAIGFAGEYVHTNARLSWSASNASGYHFVANPLSNGFAEVGHSRNGMFF